jgi:hypothetical protein
LFSRSLPKVYPGAIKVYPAQIEKGRRVDFEDFLYRYKKVLHYGKQKAALSLYPPEKSTKSTQPLPLLRRADRRLAPAGGPLGARRAGRHIARLPPEGAAQLVGEGAAASIAKGAHDRKLLSASGQDAEKGELQFVKNLLMPSASSRRAELCEGLCVPRSNQNSRVPGR